MKESLLLAVKASYDVKDFYAILQLDKSFSDISISFIDLDPDHNLDIFIDEKFNPKEIISISCAITRAYSSIEELGLGVNPEGGRKTHDEDGSWIPEVKKDLLKRLKENNINTGEKFIWDLRGEQEQKVEDLRRIINKSKAIWARENVRDEEIDILDAIDTASSLRNKLGAHNLSKEKNIKYLQDLPIFAATNVQQLARRLVLEKFGIWADIKKQYENT